MHKPHYRNPVRNLHALGLADEDADVNAYRKGSEPALVWAADYGTPIVVKALLARGAKVDARVRNGLTALDFASRNGHEENLRLLLVAGADADFRDEDGYSPLMSACNARIARRLLERGAKVNARTKDGWTPLLGAVLHGEPKLVAFLLAKGADIHARDAEGQTALLFHMGHLNDRSHGADLAITSSLLQAGARVNDRDNAGESPLWKAVHRLRCDANAADTVRLLLDAGASVSDASNADLLAWAKRHGYDETASLLTSAGVQAS